MSEKLNNLMHRLNKDVGSDRFLDTSEEVAEELGQMQGSFAAVEPILRLFEKNPHVDFGMPGPLVHFVERFFRNGYETLLVESVRRAPTRHTLWMLNRIINGSAGDEKASFIKDLDFVLKMESVDPAIWGAAMEFRRLHG